MKKRLANGVEIEVSYLQDLIIALCKNYEIADQLSTDEYKARAMEAGMCDLLDRFIIEHKLIPKPMANDEEVGSD